MFAGLLTVILFGLFVEHAIASERLSLGVVRDAAPQFDADRGTPRSLAGVMMNVST